MVDSDADEEVENVGASGNVSDTKPVREKFLHCSTPLPPSTAGDRSTREETSTSMASTSSCSASTPLPPSKNANSQKNVQSRGYGERYCRQLDCHLPKGG